MVEFFLKEQSLTLFSRGSSTEISLISCICIHTSSFIETVFSEKFLFWPDLLRTSIPAPWKLCRLHLIVSSACFLLFIGHGLRRAAGATQGICWVQQLPANQMSVQKHFIFINVILNFPTDRVCSCGADASGLCNLCVCNSCTHPTYTSMCVCVYLYTLVLLWGLFPCSPCGRSKLQPPNLVLSLFWGLSDQFLSFSLFWKEWCFLRLGLEPGEGIGHDTNTTTFVVLGFKQTCGSPGLPGQALCCWRWIHPTAASSCL